MQKWYLILAFFIYLLIPPDLVFAKIEVNNPPSKIEINKEFELDVTLSNLSDPVHFLSIALHKKSGDSYFGQTQNGNNWIEADDSNCKSFPSASIKEGSWSGKLKGKINYNEKDFDNTLGNYILKVFKYTDSCYKVSSGDIAVELFDSNPPPTTTPSSTPTSIPSSTPIPITKPTSVPTPIPTKLSIPSATPKPQNTPTIYVSVTPVKMPTIVKSTDTPVPTQVDKGTVLGETYEPSETPIEKEQKTATASKASSLPIFILLLGGGLGFIAVAVIVSIKQIKKMH